MTLSDRSASLPSMTARVLLDNPKYPHNVGGAYRAAACFGASHVYVTGSRVPLTPTDGYRLPREERLRAYNDEVELRAAETKTIYNLVNHHRPRHTPVVVEVSDTAEQLHHFIHPEDALYIFGPEDGSVSRYYREMGHRYVIIPSFHCLNLAGAVYTVLYDRVAKRRLAGLEEEVPSYDLMSGREGYAEHHPLNV